MKKFKLTKDHKEEIAYIIDEAVVDCTNEVTNPDSEKSIVIEGDDEDLVDQAYAQVEHHQAFELF